MENKLKSFFFYKKNLSIFLLGLFPITLVLGPLVAEIFIAIINILYLLSVSFNKLFKDNNFRIFIIVWIYLLLNIFISENNNFEFLRQVFYIRYIVFAFAISFFLSELKNLKFIFFSWLMIASVLYFDLIFEKINGQNLLGYKSPNSLRLVSFLKDELKIAYIISAFCFILSGYLLEYYKKYYLSILFLLLTIFIILITGERSNFLKSIIFLSTFILINKNQNFREKLLILLVSITVIITSINLVPTTQKLYTQLIDRITFKEDNQINIMKNFKSFPHSGHYFAAYEIANDYPWFGVGIKNFRQKCVKKKYRNIDVPWSDARCGTHPHQLYFEIISETGYLGLFFILGPFFIFFYKNLIIYFRNQNLLHLATLCFLISQFMPILPSGSFFTNFNCIVIWFNIGFLLTAARLPKINH